jgi:hypothetical protein
MLNGLGSSDINDFMKNVHASLPGYVSEMYGWYANPHWVDFIGKQESLCDDLLHVLEMLDLPHDPDRIRSMPLANVSSEEKLTIEWDRGLLDETLKLEYPAMVRYGYADNPFFVPKQLARD